MESVWALLFFFILVVCWALTFAGLPGNWLMALATSAYVYCAPVKGAWTVGGTVLIPVLVLAAVGEVIEFAASSWGVVRAGGSRRGAVLTLFGSVLGGLIGLFVGLPIPLLGPVVGALIFGGVGALLGAMVGECQQGRNFQKMWDVGRAAFWARLLGTFTKTLIGLVILVVIVTALLA